MYKSGHDLQVLNSSFQTILFMSEFSIRAGKRIIKAEGDKRVSDKASIALNSKLERFAGDVAQLAIQEAEEDDRKTVRGRDIRKALR